jgi:hypothetical protein
MGSFLQVSGLSSASSPNVRTHTSTVYGHVLVSRYIYITDMFYGTKGALTTHSIPEYKTFNEITVKKICVTKLSEFPILPLL